MADDPTIPSNVYPSATEEPAVLNPVATVPKKAAEDRADSPPKPPAAKREQSAAQPIQPAQAGGGTTGGQSAPAKGTDAPSNVKPAPPAAPGADPADQDLKPAPIENGLGTRRDNLKPIYTNTSPIRADLRNVLVGRVESESGEPLGEVTVAVARVDNTAIRRSGMTNAFGGFAIRLADGEWNVNVRMPSGRYYPVRTVTVNNGKIVDNQERREVRNLLITY
jgi:hypothetical protein